MNSIAFVLSILQNGSGSEPMDVVLGLIFIAYLIGSVFLARWFLVKLVSKMMFQLSEEQGSVALPEHDAPETEAMVVIF